jgi:patatin-related protein
MADLKETRIGLVLNGGVSLAVWMGGVTHELDLLRRASRCAAGVDDGDDVADHDRGVFDAWVDFCRTRDVGRVLVDVIAGTSAGGLNGALLATAVGRGVALDPARPGATGPRLREMWDRSARLEHGALLRSPDRPALPSVLDGEFFEQTVSAELGAIGAGATAVDDDPVTLFTTATALGTSSVRYTDAFDHPFDIADHRRLYRFVRTERGVCTYQPTAGSPDDDWFPAHDVNDFEWSGADHGPVDPLTRAARATASFPIAFAPVEETPELVAHRLIPPRQQRTRGATWLADGGILNNSPFEPVLDAITSRQVSGEVDRLLIYIVPSEGVRAVDWKQADDVEAADGPAVSSETWKSIAAKALGLPGESDLRNDIDLTHDLVSRAEGSSAGPEALFGAAIRRLVDADATDSAERRRLEDSAAGLCDQYRLARTVGGLREARAELGVAQHGPSRALRPTDVTDAVRLLDEHRPAWVPPADGELRPDAYDDRADGWCWGLDAAERVARLMLRDLRRTHRDDDGDVGAAMATISRAQAHISAVRRTVIDALRQVEDGARFARDAEGDAALVEEVGALFTELRVPVALLWCVNVAATAYASVVDGLDPDGAVRVGLAVEVVSQAFTAYRPAERTPPFKLLRLGPDVDTPVCDADGEAAEGGEDDDRAVVGDAKLYGARLGHFGAFGQAEWRSWDWMCGRLDAQTHLVRALAGGQPHAPEVEQPIIALQRAVLETEGDGMTPDAFAERRAELSTQTDAKLLEALGTTEQGRMLVEVFDAVMRAVPQPLALAARGQLINTLLARHPERRWRPWWAGLARFPVRWWWRGRVWMLTRGGRGRGGGASPDGDRPTAPERTARP